MKTPLVPLKKEPQNIELIFSTIPSVVILKIGSYFFPATQDIQRGTLILANPIVLLRSQQQADEYLSKVYANFQQNQQRMTRLVDASGEPN